MKKDTKTVVMITDNGSAVLLARTDKQKITRNVWRLGYENVLVVRGVDRVFMHHIPSDKEVLSVPIVQVLEESIPPDMGQERG